MSIDGGTAESFERIRVGESFDRVIANLDRFIELVAPLGGGVNIAHCPMVDNWEALPQLLQLAERRGASTT